MLKSKPYRVWSSPVWREHIRAVWRGELAVAAVALPLGLVGSAAATVLAWTVLAIHAVWLGLVLAFVANLVAFRFARWVYERRHPRADLWEQRWWIRREVAQEVWRRWQEQQEQDAVDNRRESRERHDL